MKSFLKKEPVYAQRTTQEAVFDKKNDVYFVNPEKYDRAKEIIAFILGKKVPQDIKEQERKEHYIQQLAKHEVDPASDTAIPAIYELIGGLIRTPSEQKEAERNAIEIKKKGKKKMIE